VAGGIRGNPPRCWPPRQAQPLLVEASALARRIELGDGTAHQWLAQ
jgi:hypothetical protein